MNNTIFPNKEKLSLISLKSFDIISETDSKLDALAKISDLSSAEFGDFFGPEILGNTDEISTNFIELLDQIIFEINKNDLSDSEIFSYIVDDLFHRVSIYLQAFKDIDIYKNSLYNRLLTYDDLIIIKHYKLYEYIPEMISEFYDQINIQKHILRTLIALNPDDQLKFYYEVFSDTKPCELKCMSLIGLKRLSNKFHNWHKLQQIDPELSDLIKYAENFSIENINNIPEDILSLFFLISYIEIDETIKKIEDYPNLLINLFSKIFSYKDDTIIFTEFHLPITNIILSLEQEILQKIIKSSKGLIIFNNIIELLPGIHFNRIIYQLKLLNKPFIEKTKELISSKKILIDDNNSNIMNFIIWNISEKVTL